MVDLKEKVIVIDPDKCTGCHSCEMACSMKNFSKSHPYYSRVRINEFREVNTFIPVTCQACEEAPCIKVCPMGARYRTENGAVVTNEDACIGCRACSYACPTGAPVINPDNGKTMSCDKCAGEEMPWCVKACTMQGALQYVPKYMVAKTSGKKHAWELKEEYKPQLAKNDDETKFNFSFS